MANPFHELYIGERISSREFVSVFSTVLVEHATPLFQPGNVVLAGVQGSGKSMLFKLLAPEIRQEYARAQAEFPVPTRMARFIGAGINLNQSDATQFGLRKTPEDPIIRGLLFGDFFNYVITSDLIRSVQTIAEGPSTVSTDLGVLLSSDKSQDFVKMLKADDVWNGYLDDVNDLASLQMCFKRRLAHYRQFMHGNRDNLDEAVLNTKTSVGMPVASIARALKACEIVPDDINIFIHVDQYEEIGTIGKDVPGLDYKAVVNRALNRRDPTISYRIGTRSYAWHSSANIFGTDAKLEQERDYKFIDLDEKLRRYEDRTSWIFPAFAKDVFARRLKSSGVPALSESPDNLMRQVLGTSVSAKDKALLYAGQNRGRAVRQSDDIDDQTAQRLLRLAAEDPLTARLGEAWVSQKGANGINADPPPWEAKEREWWRKERVDLALLQIASRTQQRPIASGDDEVIALSGGNILAFLTISQLIWDLANQAKKTDAEFPEFPIKISIQAQGIRKASEYWLNKILQEVGNSGDRFKFIKFLGQNLSKHLLDDRKMSYPGHNGFSLTHAELERIPQVKDLLLEASEFGNLVMLPHTTKERDRAPRNKWYIAPIYCIALKIPFNRIKEPIYIKADDVVGWLIKAGVIEDDGRRRRTLDAASKSPPADLFASE